MAVGDQNDMQSRLQAVLPSTWFPDTGATILGGVLAGIAAIWSSVWNLLTYVQEQTRIATATEGNLDLVAVDFFGPSFTRLPGELDAAFRARIKAALFQPEATRAAMVSQLIALTGNTPTIVEPRRPADTGGYASMTVAGGGGVGYGVAGAYGSSRLPFQCFLTIQRPINPGIPGVGGYSGGVTGYGTLTAPNANVGASQYASASQLAGASDADIYAAIAACAPCASVVWTKIVDPIPAAGDRLDVNLFLDRSALG